MSGDLRIYVFKHVYDGQRPCWAPFQSLISSIFATEYLIEHEVR